MTKPVELPGVTIVTIDTTENRLTRLAIDDSLDQIKPAELIIFTDEPMLYPNYAGINQWFVNKNPLDTEGVYQTLWYDVPRFVSNSHILTIQWDGWVLDGSLWNPEFLSYDYIGAPWPWHTHHRVGNGGFSLRSKRLLEFLSANRDRFPFRLPCDDAICREYRRALEAHGFRFAPEPLAWTFSREHGEANPPCYSFGFHDPRNFRRYLSREKFQERINAAGPYALKKLHELGVLK